MLGSQKKLKKREETCCENYSKRNLDQTVKNQEHCTSTQRLKVCREEYKASYTLRRVQDS